MNWNNLFDDFLNGKADAIQAFASLMSLLIAIVGTYFIIRSFREQGNINKKQALINEQQVKLNEYSLNSHVRQLRPMFTIDFVKSSFENKLFIIILRNAMALHLYFRFYDLNGDEVTSLGISGFHCYPGEGEIERQVLYMDELLNKNLTHRIAALDFEDEEGRLYNQELWFDNQTLRMTSPQYMGKVNITPPITT